MLHVEGENMLNIQTDSRKIRPGDTFVAVRCEVNDGHKYIESAIEKGATKIVVEHQDKDYGIETLVVPDTRKYITEYLHTHYHSYLSEMNLIGITGTNGKTTTAYLIYEAFNKLGIKCGYIGTIGFYLKEKVMSLPNTSVDICDTYDLIMRAYDQGYRTLVMEVSSHALANHRLEGIDYQMTLFTNLTEDHLDFHKTMENYAKAKQQLFKQLRPHGCAIVNGDDDYKDYFILDQNRNLRYGFSKGCDYQIVKYQMNNVQTVFTYCHLGQENMVCIKMLGKYNIYNALLAIVVLKENGITDEQISEVFKTLSCPPGRMDTVVFGTNSIIVDYAHTPDALQKIIETVRPITKGHLYTVFGCTGDRERKKRPIMSKIATTLSDYVIMTSDDPHNEDMSQIISDMTQGLEQKNYEVIVDRGDAIEKGISLLEENDTLLVLGKGHEEVIIVGNRRIPFNDKEFIQKCVQKRAINN